MFNHGSLFSGIGGFDLAAEWVGWNNIFCVENNAFCQKVLQKNFPLTRKYIDIFDFNGEEFRDTIDVISGGFPCQPFSSASAVRLGTKDTRYLWPEMRRVIGEIRPRFVVCENVPGIVNLALDEILLSLETLEYTTSTYIIPASAVGAYHKRERIWIVAHTSGRRWKNSISELPTGDTSDNGTFQVDPNFAPIDPMSALACSDKADFRGIIDGVPNWLDRVRALGNAIVPQVAFRLFQTINEILLRN